MNDIPELFLTFARIGLFTFGGGYAMIPLIEDICVEKKKWITHDEMMNLAVIAESTPGPIAINCATFVGFRQGGLTGAARIPDMRFSGHASDRYFRTADLLDHPDADSRRDQPRHFPGRTGQRNEQAGARKRR